MCGFAIVGYQLKACPDSFFGTSHRAMEDEVSKKADAYIAMLQQSAEMYEEGEVMLALTPHYPPFLSPRACLFKHSNIHVCLS